MDSILHLQANIFDSFYISGVPFWQFAVAILVFWIHCHFLRFHFEALFQFQGLQSRCWIPPPFGLGFDFVGFGAPGWKGSIFDSSWHICQPLPAVWQVEELGEDGAFDAALMEAFVRETQDRCPGKKKERVRKI